MAFLAVVAYTETNLHVVLSATTADTTPLLHSQQKKELPMPNIEISISRDLSVQVYCGKCGSDLSLSDVEESAKSSYSQPEIKITVEECETCIENAREAGYDEGYNYGMEQGGDTDA